EIDRSGDQPLQRALATPADERVDPLRRLVAQLAPQGLGDFPLTDQRTGDVLVMHRADLLERMREGVVADAMNKRGGARELDLFADDEGEVRLVLEKRADAPGEVIRADGVLEPRMSRPGVDEEGEA